MNQAELQHLVRALRIRVGRPSIRMKQSALQSKYRERLEATRATVSALVANERIEVRSII